MKRSRPSRAGAAARQPPPKRFWIERSDSLLLACAVTLMVAAALIPNSSAVAMGSHVVLVMAWFPLTVAWLLWCLAQPQPNWRLGPASFAFAAFLIVHTVSALVMGRWGHGRPSLNAMWIWASFGLVFLTVRQLARRGIEARAICSVMTALATGLAAFGLYQYAYAMPKMRADYAARPEAELVEMGMDPAPDSPGRAQFENRLRSTEPIGPFALTNTFAGFLVPWVVLLAGIAVSAWESSKPRWQAPTGVGVATLLLAACLLLTKSRSAYLALLAGIGILVLTRAIPRHWLRWRRVLALTVVLAALFPIAISLGSLDREVVTEAFKSFLYRLQYWQASSRMIADYPWLGCGPGNFQDYYAQYKLPEASELVADPHNYLFEVASTAGLPALLLFVATGAVVLIQVGRRRINRQAEPRSRELPTTCGEEEGSGRARSIYAGLPLGLILAFPAAWAGGVGPDFALVWVALPVASAMVWLMHPWVLHGQLTLWPMIVAVTALLIHLLAAGGIGYPAIGQIIWVLAALMLNMADDSLSIANLRDRYSVRGKMTVAFAMIAASLLSVACYLTMYRPMLGARGHLADARHAANPVARERSAYAAVLADPWWAEPATFLAGMLCRQWIESPSPERLRAFDRAVELALDRSRRSSNVLRRSGDWLIEMAVASSRQDLAERAANSYARATELYPNSNILHAQLAWSYFLCGQRDMARDAAADALRLDELTPHAEQKLAKQRLEGDLRTSPGQPPTDASELQTAEQCMDYIRKSSGGG